jgi:hypothetical protein
MAVWRKPFLPLMQKFIKLSGLRQAAVFSSNIKDPTH